jgi:HK97 family phage portal protein
VRRFQEFDMPSFVSRLLAGGRRVAAPSPHPLPEQKRSRVAPLVALSGPGRPVWTPSDYASLARESYARNAVAFRCVRMVADAVAGLSLVATREGRDAPGHPLLALVARPNPRQTGAGLLETLSSHLMLSGNAFLEGVAVDGRPRELYALRPDRVRVVPGPDGWPEAFDYSVAGRTIRLVQEGVPPPVLHIASFNPLDDHYGHSPVEAAATALDLHNAASAWQKALLDNAARPSGALIYAAGEGASLTDAQFERLKGELEAQFQGAANAGRPLVLDGGLDWKPLSLTPQEMDFQAARAAAAREIALAFGVPPMLIGLPGDNTYANYAEANRAFYRLTVVPLATRLGQAIGGWLGPAWGEASLTLQPDLDAIEALAEDRESLWQRVSAAEFLSDDEKREALGYKPRLPAKQDMAGPSASVLPD